MGTNKDKGDILEDLVAMIHRGQGLNAAPRQFLPSKANPTDQREIDVLIKARIGPYDRLLAIECRNRLEAVDVADIGEFRDKLDDVGLPHQGSIYVAHRYTKNAIERAVTLGI